MQITVSSLVFGAMGSLRYMTVLRKTIIENTTSSIREFRGNIIMTVALFRCCMRLVSNITTGFEKRADGFVFMQLDEKMRV
jgi:hypothetical protein